MVKPLRFVSLRRFSAVFGNRRWPSEIFWNNPDLSQNGRKLVDIYILNKTILAFLEPFFASSSWKKFNVSKNFLPLVLKCLKFNCFMLQSQNSEVFSVIEVPPFRPSLRDSLNNCQTRRGLTVCVLTKKKDFVATIECEKIRQKPRYTVNEVLLTKNSLRAPFVARNNSLLRLHWRPTLCGSKKQNKNAR